MFKYAVLIDAQIEKQAYEETVVGFYDTQEEAERVAAETAVNYKASDPSKIEISVAKIDDQDLDDPNDWESFNDMETLSIYPIAEE